MYTPPWKTNQPTNQPTNQQTNKQTNNSTMWSLRDTETDFVDKKKRFRYFCCRLLCWWFILFVCLFLFLFLILWSLINREFCWVCGCGREVKTWRMSRQECGAEAALFTQSLLPPLFFQRSLMSFLSQLLFHRLSLLSVPFTCFLGGWGVCFPKFFVCIFFVSAPPFAPPSFQSDNAGPR